MGDGKGAAPARGRNYGVDALRLAAAFMVVLVHILNHGGALGGARGVNYWAGCLLGIVAYSAPNCFALISGYVGYTPEPRAHRYARYACLWLEVALYSVLGTVAAGCLAGGVRVGDALKSLLPVTREMYWYFTAYTGVFFLIPWLNRLVRSCENRALDGLVLTLMLLFSVYATLARPVGDPLALGKGYSFLWLAVLYVVGAWMRKRDIPAKISGGRAALLGAALALAAWLSKLGISALERGLGLNFGEEIENILGGHTSPLLAGLAMALLICFARMRPRGLALKAIRIFSPAAFGAYLIHTHPRILSQLIGGRFAGFGSGSLLRYLALVLGTALATFCASVAIDMLRQGLFRAARVRALCDRAEARVRARLHGLARRS